MSLKLALVPLLSTAASSSSSPQWAPWKGGENATSEMGGCGWSKCYNCVGGHCSPANQKCTGKPPKYTFHLADPTCDINDPNGPFYDPVHGARISHRRAILPPRSNLPFAHIPPPRYRTSLEQSRLRAYPTAAPSYQSNLPLPLVWFVKGMYHNFYQIHIAEYQNGIGDGPDWGHWVSRDFIKWTQLPVAIW
jgi:hypothetical protein